MIDQAALGDARLLSWDAFRATFLEPAVGADIPVPGEPPIRLFVEPAAARIGLRVRTDEEAVPDPLLRSVSIGRAGDELVVATADRELFQPFYALLLDLSDRIQLAGTSVTAAIEDALHVWRRLLAGLGGLTDDEQLGLSGELWTLSRLVRSEGPSVVQAWLGPTSEAHDFRTPKGEIEVKTTRGEQRRHRISRFEQLEASPKQRLYILSLQFSAAGAAEGWTLQEQIDGIRTLLRENSSAERRFEQLLASARWADDDAAMYARRWLLRSPAVLVEVDDKCPRLTPTVAGSALDSLVSRIDDVSYRVNLEGLGVADGEQLFLSVLPAPPPAGRG